MTRIFNDPANFANDQLEGFLDLYADRLRGVKGGVVAHRNTEQPKVAVIAGGGSGHYPAFCGVVGPGLATGAVVGNIFTSPSASAAYNVGHAADTGKGVIFSFGNYAGDNMNFGIASQRLGADGIDARCVVVTDDIASAPEFEKRRGIAGDFTVFKAMGAAAEEGADIDEVERLGRKANEATRTLGVAFSGCTMPGSDEPLFEVPEGHLGLGLGIHGEPGIEDIKMLDADALASLLVQKILADAPDGFDGRVAPILNGLGTTKYEELFLLWGVAARLLREQGLTLVQPEVGELVTSLDMGGCSLTLMWLDDELERLWCADAYTPAYRRVAAPVASLTPDENIEDDPAGAARAEAADESEASVAFAASVRRGLEVMEKTIASNESELGRIDAVAGDGDHGRGMIRGVRAALGAVGELPDGAGTVAVFRAAGRGWADDAGGTSGVLWGAALEAFGQALGFGQERGVDEGDFAEQKATRVAAAVQAFADAIVELGGASKGDKTLLDSLLPFAEELRRRVDGGDELAAAWSGAAEVATGAAEDTATLRPKVGRARPLAEKSVGTPDAGATSMALIVTDLGNALSKGEL